MMTALYLIGLQGILGACDTIYYHEYVLRLPYTASAKSELKLHAARDFVYTMVFLSMAWLEWRGALAWCFLGILLFEVVVTILDFLEEDETRRLPKGERIMHSIMAIIYGGFLAFLLPEMWQWSRQETAFATVSHGYLSWVFTIMAVGVFASGLRDTFAARRL